MSGLYTHTTRGAGTTLTASIYNADHVNHITNHVFTMLDDHSTNASQMQATKDPYSSDTIQLATDGSEELEHMRFQIDSLVKILNPSASYWYENVYFIRSVVLRLEPGTTPGTHIDITDLSSGKSHNSPAITNATDLTKSGTNGSFSLNAGGTEITMNITENIVGILGASTLVDDAASGATSATFPNTTISANNLLIYAHNVGSSSTQDFTSLMSASSRLDFLLTFVTSS